MTSTMSRGVSSVLVAAFVVAAQVASAGVAQADEFVPKWRDGWCKKGEGQSVVVDFTDTPRRDRPKGLPAEGVVIRCNIGAKYPAGAEGRMAALEAVQITYEVDSSGLVDNILGIPMDYGKQKHWMYTTSKPGSTAWDGGWQPTPTLDTAVGVTWGGNAKPTVNPQFS